MKRRELLNALVFDLDGTLLDSYLIHFASYRTALARFGITLTEETFVKAYSPYWNHTYSAVGLPEAFWNTASSIWRAEARKHTASLFPDVRDALLRLRNRYSSALVSSGSKARVFDDLERTEIQSLFSAVVTGDDVRHPKPSPEGLKHVLATLKMQPHEIVYIGDAISDYEMAKAVEVEFLGIKSAFSVASVYQREFPLKSVAELPTLLEVE